MKEIQAVNRFIRDNYKTVFPNQKSMGDYLGITRVSIWYRFAERQQWNLDELIKLDKAFKGGIFNLLNSI